ncbi:MAG TPA: hypothetical protein VHD62_14845 [Opitutaceae bacterium]|nr:hypothetical protein [Opitutaceae bacterium]
MKTLAVWLLALGLLVGNAFAAAPAKKDKDAKKEEPAKIEGVPISRGDRGFLGVRIVDGNLRVTFYDAKKKPMAPDVVRAIAHWPVKYQSTDERTVLNPGGDEHSLMSAKVVKPPYAFKLFITLMTTGPDGNEVASENYTLDFHQ